MAPMGEFLKREAEGSLHSAAMFFGGERGARVDELFLHCVKTGESGGPQARWWQLDKLAAKRSRVDKVIQRDDDRFFDPASDRCAGGIRFFSGCDDRRRGRRPRKDHFRNPEKES